LNSIPGIVGQSAQHQQNKRMTEQKSRTAHTPAGDTHAAPEHKKQN
jgi:hypothetical protein